MSESLLPQRLYENYNEHYNRRNLGAANRPPEPKFLADMDATLLPYMRGLRNPERMLDAGCGTGHLLYWLHKRFAAALAGVDLSAAQIEAARALVPEASLHAREATQFLAECRGHYDAVFAFDLVEHIRGDDNLLAFADAVRGSLREGGAFVCRTPNAANLLAGYSRYADLTHERLFTTTSLAQLLETAGFSRVDILPVRVSSTAGRVRRAAEDALHYALFKLTGHSTDTVFTSNLIAAARR